MHYVRVYQCANEMEAQMLSQLLESEGISCLLNSDVPPSIYPVTAGALGEIDLLVDEEQAEQAKELLVAYEASADVEEDDGERT
jgi:hypothetical protein